MADQNHLEILSRGVDVWNNWGVDVWNNWRAEFSEVQPEVSVAYLTTPDLSGADLSNTDLSGADLSKADLSHANLVEADLSEADLCVNRKYVLAHGMTGVDWKHYKHPLPEDVYDTYMRALQRSFPGLQAARLHATFGLFGWRVFLKEQLKKLHQADISPLEGRLFFSDSRRTL